MYGRQNPAEELYSFWLMHYSRYSPHGLRSAREWVEEKLNEDFDLPKWNRIYDSLEENSEAEFLYRRSYTSLDYRLGVRIVGMSNAHLEDEPPAVRSPDDFQPIFQLIWKNNHGALFTLWPDGSFEFNVYPRYIAYVLATHTFIKRGWVASHSVWVVSHKDDAIRWSGRYVYLDWKNWEVPEQRLYLPLDTALEVNERYELTDYDADDAKFLFHQWLIKSKWSWTATRDLKSGYDRARRRYARFKRSSELRAEEARTQEARSVPRMYAPGRGRLVGDEAVAEFAQHLRFYNRAGSRRP